MRSLTAPLIKSIIFIVATVLATALLAVSIAQTDSGPKHHYNARFTDVSGLRVGDSIRIAGVQIGRVEKIRIVDRRLAEVRFTADKDRKLPASTTATIMWLNVVGQRYVQLAQGAGEMGELKPNGTIPSERTTPAVDLTLLFNGFRPMFQAMSPDDVNKLAGSLIQVLQGEGGTLESLLTSVGSLTSTIASKDEVIGQVVTNLTEVLETVNSRGDEFGDLVGTMRKLIGGLAADSKPIGQAIEAMDELAITAADLLEKGRPALKKDIAELGRLSKNLADESPTVERFLKLLPAKMSAIIRLGTYGSWLNFFICEVDLKGAGYKPYPGESHPPLTGIPNTATRCTS